MEKICSLKHRGINTLSSSAKNIPIKAGVIFSDPVHFFAFGFGSGLAPVAPGTFGSVVGVLLAYFMLSLSPFSYIALTVVLFLVGVWICDASSKKLGVHDHGGIVWDEIVGIMITFFMLPSGWQWLLLGFCLFRVFDIIKPWPIKLLDEKVDGGFGIMIDDVLAGLFALVCVQLVILVVKQLGMTI